MPRIFTCGSPAKRKQFEYEGDYDSGFIIKYPSGSIKISHDFLEKAIARFEGREVKGGFLVTNPTPVGSVSG